MLDLLGYLAGIVMAVGMVPQAVRIVRHGAEGVAFGTWAGLVVVVSLWLAYGVELGSLPILVANVASGLIAIIIVAGILRDRDGWHYVVTVPVLGVVVAAGVAALSFVPLVVLAAIAVVLSIAARYPQAAASWRTRQTAEHSQVAVSTWVATGVGHSLWFAYGFTIFDVPTMVTNMVLAVSCVLIVVWERQAAVRANATTTLIAV